MVTSQLRPGPRRQFIVCRVEFDVPPQRAQADKGGARIIGQEALSRQCKVRFSATPPMLCRYLVSGAPCPVPATASPSGREKSGFDVRCQLAHGLFWGCVVPRKNTSIVQIRKHREIVKMILMLDAEPLAHIGNGRGPVSLSKMRRQITVCTAPGLSAWPCETRPKTCGQVIKYAPAHRCSWSCI